MVAQDRDGGRQLQRHDRDRGRYAGPRGLATIIPQVAISRWYEYAYSGGIRYLYTNEFAGNRGIGGATEEGFDTPLAFDFGFAAPPPLDVTNDHWAERVESSTRPCDELEHTLHGYDFNTPDYDAFWRRRDYIRLAARIDIPVLIAGNWGDYNVKQEGGFNLFRALRRTGNRDVHLFFGGRWNGHSSPGGDFNEVKAAWLDHYLKGADNGVDRLAPVTTQTATSEGNAGFRSGRVPRTRRVVLYPQNAPRSVTGDYPWKLLPTRPRPRRRQVATFPSLGTNTEMAANHQARNNLAWFWFETPPLRRNARVFGKIKLDLYSSIHRRWVTVTPTIVDVDPNDRIDVGGHEVNTDPKSLVSVTRGFLDSRYRRGLARAREHRPGAPVKMTVVAKPTDYVFTKGHRIGLQVQTEINEWMVPKVYPGCDGADQRCARFRVRWERGRTRLKLPLVRPPQSARRLFARAG